MKTNENTAKALSWALREGLDNSSMNVELNPVDPVYHYGIVNLINDIRPHLALYVTEEQAELIPKPDHVGIVTKDGRLNGEIESIIAIYEL